VRQFHEIVHCIKVTELREWVGVHAVSYQISRADRNKVMRTRRFEQTALTTFALAACVMFFMAAHAGLAHAQLGLTLPETPEMPVSPITPGLLPGTTAQDIGIGTNPITGAPCLGGGSSAINGGLPDVSTAPDQSGTPDVAGLPPSTSVFGLSSEVPNTDTAGAC
jgi:hypothetical protein